MADRTDATLRELTVDVVSAFVSNNSIRSEDLAHLIQSTHDALAGLGQNASSADSSAEEFTGAVTARKSLGSREHIISMIDGKPYKTLKRHLSGHGLTPDEYRARYKLPASYPMVAPAYSERRREVAKQLGLGTNGRGRVPAAAKPAAGRGRGRPRKS